MKRANPDWRNWQLGDPLPLHWIPLLIAKKIRMKATIAILKFRPWKSDRWRRRLSSETVATSRKISEAIEREVEARGDHETAREQRNLRLWLLKGRDKR